MKVLQDGKIKLSKNEKRLGNFVVAEEENHIKIFDINQMFVHRVRKSIAIGMWLEACYKGLSDEAIRKSLGNYIAVLWSASCVVPDVDFLAEVYKSSEACMNRHPELYGVPKKEASDEEDAKIVEGLKEEHEFVEQVKKLDEEEAEPTEEP